MLYNNYTTLRCQTPRCCTLLLNCTCTSQGNSGVTRAKKKTTQIWKIWLAHGRCEYDTTWPFSIRLSGHHQYTRPKKIALSNWFLPTDYMKPKIFLHFRIWTIQTSASRNCSTPNRQPTAPQMFIVDTHKKSLRLKKKTSSPKSL